MCDALTPIIMIIREVRVEEKRLKRTLEREEISVIYKRIMGLTDPDMEVST